MSVQTSKTKRTQTRKRAQSLASALEREFDMTVDDASEVARIVETTFGKKSEVNDDDLDSETRSIFYTLESKRLLSFRREEYEKETGEKRRAFYWRVKSEELERLTEKPEGMGAMDGDVYDNLPAQAWRRVQA